MRDVGDLKSGETAKFTVIRSGKTIELTVRIDARDESAISDSSKLWPGFFPSEITESLRKRLDIDENQKGVFVANVMSKSPAAVMGLQSGDIIVKVNDRDVASLQEFYSRMADVPSGEVWFSVLREGHELSTIRYKR